MIKTERFGYTSGGEEVLLFTLGDERSYVQILNLGGILQAVVVPDKDGKPTDVVLGYPDAKAAEACGGGAGALIGRFANRIHAGKMTVDGVEYSLYVNDRGNHLHGGMVGFNKKIWSHEVRGEELILTLFSPDGEENYPGNLQVEVHYSFVNRALKIEYFAVSDKKTVVNLTNHAYFNLNGEGSGEIYGHTLRIDSDYITPTDENMIPMGGFKAVEGTPFDFRMPKTIGEDIDEKDIDLEQGGGYDHCYLLKGGYYCYAEAKGDISGITMSCYTDAPAVQLYTANGLSQEGKTGYYGRRAGFCLETGGIPNSVNVPEYAAKAKPILDVGEEYHYTAIFKFA